MKKVYMAKIFGGVLLSIVLAIMPLSAIAVNVEEEMGTADLLILGTLTTVGHEQVSEDLSRLNPEWKKITITEHSLITVKTEVPAYTYKGEGKCDKNDFTVSLHFPNGTKIDSIDGGSDINVSSDTPATMSKSLQFKLMPGDYYVKFASSYWQNGFGTILITSESRPDDQGGDLNGGTDNDILQRANEISIGTNIAGSINYKGRSHTDGSYNWDNEDWYKFTLSENNTCVKLEFLHKDVGQERDMTAVLCDQNGYTRGDSVNLKNTTSGTTTFTYETKGTYFVKVSANWWMPASEYEIKLTLVETPSIKLNKEKASIHKGEKLQLTAEVKGDNKEVEWTSSNKDVAIVSETGLVEVLKSGTATIYAKVKNVSNLEAYCVVTVIQPVKSVKLNKKKITLKKATGYYLSATVKPVTATNKNVTWKSSKKKVATVSSSGYVFAKKKGTAVITVKTKDGKKTAQCKVKVKK